MVESKRAALEREFLEKVHSLSEQLEKQMEKQKMPLKAKFWLWLLKRRLKSFR